ncbi:hypothetical protein ABZ897_57525 [Nonomuraea sp. NPDC046802]|uniref:hypothetical protein n=1 Tax=Nonomuraea sp. NPDC046802 TaxID=3154919 RepID=UPI0033C66247
MEALALVDEADRPAALRELADDRDLPRAPVQRATSAAKATSSAWVTVMRCPPAGGRQSETTVDKGEGAA